MKNPFLRVDVLRMTVGTYSHNRTVSHAAYCYTTCCMADGTVAKADDL